MSNPISPSTMPQGSKTVVRYGNLAGAIVTVDSHPHPGAALAVFTATSTGCLETYDRESYATNIRTSRTWAAEHSATCRALPQPATDDRQ